MSEPDLDRLTELATHLTVLARASGAEVAEAQARTGWELSTRVRLGEIELLQEAGQSSLYLRVFRNQRVALTSTSDTSEAGRARCVADAMELLELSEADPFAGPAEEPVAEPPWPDLDLYDPNVEAVDAADAIRRAREMEQAALDSDPRLTLSEGASVSRVSGGSALVLSTGFSASQRGSYISMSVAPVAMDEGDKRRRGSYWDARRHLDDLASPESVGREAARRALRQLGPRKIDTCEAPVIFESDVARSLVGTFAGCICGGALWRKSSYLQDRLGDRVASDLVNLVDDPLRPRGPGSRAFDGEGLASRVNRVVGQGRLESYLLDSYSARKLDSKSTHSASRGGAAVGAGTSNFIMEPGDISREELISQTKQGLYVTEMMGFGFNAVTGDFSRGASGFWIEDGKLAFPVSELTISGNLDKMLKDVDAVANDFDPKTQVAAPTFRISKMTIGGQ